MNMKLFCTTILALIVTLNNVYSQTTSSEKDISSKIISEKYMQGVFEINVRENTKRAAVLFAEILEIDSTHAPSHFMLSKILGSDVEMLKHIELANEYDKTNKWYQNSLSEIYLKNNDLDNAIKVALLTLEQNPEDHFSYYDIAKIYLSFGKYQEAEETINKFEEKFGENDESLFYKVQIYERTVPSVVLIDKLKELAIKNPHSQQIHTVLGGKYSQMQNRPEALKYYKIAEQLGENDVKLLLSFVDFYLQGNDVKNVVTYIRKIFINEMVKKELKVTIVNDLLFSPQFYKTNSFDIGQLVGTLYDLYPKDKEINYIISQHYINIGMLNMAEVQYIAMIDQDIDVKMAYLHLAGLYSHQKDYVKLIDTLNKISELFPDTLFGNTLQIAFVNMELGNFDVAIGSLMKLAEHTTDNIKLSETWGLIADIYHGEGDNQSAYSAYGKSIKYNKNNIVALNNYSYHLSEEGKMLKKALKMIKIVVKQEPDNATYLDTFGWILYQLGDYLEASEVLKQAVSLDVNRSTVILIHYGDALFKLGKTVNAKVYWLRAKKYGADKTEIDKRLSGKFE